MAAQEETQTLEGNYLFEKKTAKYLLQAEKLYSQHLASRSSQMPVWDVIPSPELERPLPELQYYKVLGVVGSVMLVLNTVEDRCYTIKVLHKSPCPVNTLKQSVVPQDVPYMVKLHRYYETECAVFLILQHARHTSFLELINKTFLKDELIAGRSDEKKTLSRSDSNIKELPSFENAKKLLESIKKTLVRSEIVASQTEDGAEVFHREKGDVDNMRTLTDSVNRTLVMNDSEHKMKGKSMVRCKSEDSSHVRRRRLSSGRRRSITAHTRSSERRYSSDDLMEGHGRGITGSLDRIQQLSRLKCMIDCPKPRLPEANIRVWAAELVIALNSLHQWGIICRDLNPNNILLGEKGHLLLTYMCRWIDVDSLVSAEAVEMLYAAPEVNGIFELTPAADWWSFGALIFELLTGKTLVTCHPGGIHSHTILNVPEYVSMEAKSLLTELLRYNPHERLGSGVNGIQDLKSHPFFSGIDWDAITSV
ncbi:hypothetical protein L9F63_004283 [Diploptera punctata]|uniref:Protein kinase domain-containing protein n=1 Tax=Diploptera punctata TaxID=6984 RepID=A0AAD8E7U6_DIPPU|nr:hypothetical protein L9F63_004283 [Diploptera punctata]